MFPLLTSNEIDQDFVGVLIGDVSGNWSPLGPQQQRSNVPADAPAHIRIEQTPADAQGIATATLVMDEVDEAVSSLDLVLTYDADQVEAVDVEPGASATGFDMVSNLANAGEVRVALATAAPTTNGGTLLHLRLHMQESATEPALDLAQVLINEVRVTAAAPASQVHAATPVPVYLPLVQR
jgi:hypothetical protein